MNLRQRVLIALGTTLVLLVVGIYLISSRLLLRSYEQLENQRTSRNVDRTRKAFSQLVGELHNRTVDWAFWDDTYKFMTDRNRAFIQSNLVETSLMDMHVDAAVLLDRGGNIFESACVRRLHSLPQPNVKTLTALLQPCWRNEKSPGKNTGFQGVVILEDSPILVSVRPILPTNAKGRYRGWLIFGRYFDQGELLSLAERTCLNVQMYRLEGDPSLTGSDARAIGQLSLTRPITLQAKDDQTIQGYMQVADLYGRPVLAFKTIEQRDIFSQGKRNVTVLVGTIVIAAVAFCLVMLWGLERFILIRLMSLSEQVARVGIEGAIQQRIEVAGTDEMAGLAERINHMLNALADRNEALENALDGIARLDTDGRYMATNSAYASFFDCPSEELAGSYWEREIYPEDREILRNTYQTMLKEGKAEVEVRGCRRNGPIFHMHMVLIAVYDEDGKFIGHYQFLKDVSERKRLEKQIEYQAFHDILTGLPNRLLFADRLQRAIKRMGRSHHAIAILFFDLDNFKVVNDSLGHEAGDCLLIAVAERLLSCARETDTVARLGGDEFVLLLEDLTEVQQACIIADRLVQALTDSVRLPQSEVYATGSIGIAYSDDYFETPDSLMRNADTAMYQAKERGKSGYVLFEPSMNARAVARMELELGLRRALDQHELRVVYQPLHDLKTGQLRGAEALVRWEHPDQGLISPAHFLPVAEETGLIMPISYFVLEQACIQMQAWHQEFPDAMHMVVSVNLAGKQLQDTSLVSHVAEILNRTGLPPECLCLEITEGELINDLAGTISRLNQLRDLGIQLSIDDFGTGYSSISRLNQLPVHNLKIDRAFVSRLGQEEEAAPIISAILMLSRTMHVDVTAEGIETVEQYQELMKIGCDTGQGYLFSRPLTPENFRAYITAEPHSCFQENVISRGDTKPIFGIRKAA